VSLGVGGPAERLAVPETDRELARVLRLAAASGTRVRALGGGRNLLVHDRGIRGTVVSLTRLTGTRFDGDLLVARAGTTLPALLGRAIRAGLSGLEGLSGVPGTVGGAIRMNAGTAAGSIGDRVVWVRGYDRSGDPFRFDRERCGFRYRGSDLGDRFVAEAAFALTPGGSEFGRREIGDRAREIFNRKRRTQPLAAATAGCVFKNPDGESAGRLLDEVGMKDLRRGGARISPVHANFVENAGGATFDDVMGLVEDGRRRVREAFGVELALEVEVWRK